MSAQQPTRDGGIMIISNAHRYVFVELPRTGSTAVRRELRKLYGGEPILHKHATYEEFRAWATPDQLSYFSFSGIRNPLDDAVSHYFKLKTDHGQRIARVRTKQKRERLQHRLFDQLMFRFVQRTDADFATFFMRFYVLPRDTWASLSHRKLDYVMRFEHLEEDFAEVLRRIGLERLRPLPPVNLTSSRDRNYIRYYTPETIPRARRVFGPYMERWGYKFPAEWRVQPPTALHRAEYRVFSFLARIYWRFLRPHV